MCRKVEAVRGGGGVGRHEVSSFIMEVIRVVFLSILFLLYSPSLAFTPSPNSPPLPHSPPKPQTETGHRGVLLQVYSSASAGRQTRRRRTKQQGCCPGLEAPLVHYLPLQVLPLKVRFVCFGFFFFCQTAFLLIAVLLVLR